MRWFVALVVLMGLMVAMAASAALAAPSSAGVPTIRITSPAEGALIHGRSITVTVGVSNFKLVAPILKNPPALKGNQGHIHYVLDSIKYFNPNRDVSSELSHTWSNVLPGKHTVFVYLATSQHVPLPTAKPAHVSVTLVARASPKPTRAPRPTAHTTRPGVGRAPTTGGGGGDQPTPPFNINALLMGIFAVIVGLFFLGRRYSFATVSNTVTAGSPPTPPLDRATFAVDPESSAESTGESTPSDTGQTSAENPEPTSGGTSIVPRGEPPASERPPDEPPFRMPTEPAVSQDVSTEGEITGTRALELAQQWPAVVQDLVRQLEQLESDRRQMLSRISALEQAVHAHDTLASALAAATLEPLSDEDLRAVQYVTESLLQDPDHIVVLASVAQHADRLARVVKNYARLQETLGDKTSGFR